MSAILVIAEHRHGDLRESTLEALGAARMLAAESGGEVVVALLAADPHARAFTEALEGQADRVQLVTHHSLADLETEATLAVLLPLVGALAPRLVLMGHGSQGMDIAPALAGRLGTPLVTDCTAVTLTGDHLAVERAPYGGKLHESLTLKASATTVLTLQGGAFSSPDADLATTIEEVELQGAAPRHARRFLRYLEAKKQDIDITASEVLVSVGRGIGSQDNIALAQDLADAAGGVLSCSRPVADAGWLPQSRQVGTSGQTVRPKLYIALGISGAFQHLAGMRGSETILAINKDPRAPIFGIASYGIVGDLLEVVPALTKELRG